MNTIYGIIIYLNNDTRTSDPSLGLLFDRIYLAEYPLVNIGTPYDKYTIEEHDYNIPWTTGYIAQNGIGAILKSVNLDKGGNSSNINSFQIRINNTNNFVGKLITMEPYSISLTGCKVEIIEFCGTDEKSDSISATKIFTGVIEDGVDGDESTCTLTVSTSLSRKRRANMATLIPAEDDSGDGEREIIPLTFGESDPNSGRLFRAKKIKSLEKVYTIRELLGLKDSEYGSGDFDPYNLRKLPVCEEQESSDVIKLRIGHITEFASIAQKTSSEIEEMFVGKYLVCREGAPENVGQYRKIVGMTSIYFSVYDYNHNTIAYNNATVTLVTEFFPTVPKGNWSATAEEQSWFEIVDVIAEYQIESYNETGGFYDSDGNKQHNEVDIYFTEGNRPVRSVLTDVVYSDDNNRIELKPILYNNSTGNISSYAVVQISGVEPSPHENWLLWDATDIVGFDKAEDGVWISNENPLTTLESTVSSHPERHYDKDSYTCWKFENVIAGSARYIICVRFKLPPIDDELKFHNAYLLLRLESMYSQSSDKTPNTWFSVKSRRFIGGVVDIVDTTENLGKNINISNFPDSYTGYNTKNEDFFVQSMSSNKWTGYKLFNLNVSNKEEYEDIYEMLILVMRDDKNVGYTYHTERFWLYEIAVAFETEVDISGNVFVNYKGRMSGDDLIDNPISIIEHCLRHQNYSELGIEQDWGRHMMSSEDVINFGLINTTGDGSFEADYLEDIKGMKCAFQIFDYSKAWTDSIVKSICNQFFLIHFQDGAGRECIDYMFRKDDNAPLITYGDTKGQIGALERPKARDVNCRPIVKYAYDQSTGRYTKELRVINVSETPFNVSYVSGFTETDGPTVWNECRSLFNMVGSIDDNNDSTIELPAIYRYEDAVWHLVNKLKLMKMCKLSFAVPYNTGKNWRVGTHIKLQLPHETNNDVKECIIENVSISKSNDTVSVTVLIDDVTVPPPEIDLIQEVIGQNVEQWQESIGSGEDIQEVITNG